MGSPAPFSSVSESDWVLVAFSFFGNFMLCLNTTVTLPLLSPRPFGSGKPGGRQGPKLTGESFSLFTS